MIFNIQFYCCFQDFIKTSHLIWSAKYNWLKIVVFQNLSDVLSDHPVIWSIWKLQNLSYQDVYLHRKLGGIQHSIWQLWNFKVWTLSILPGNPIHFSKKKNCPKKLTFIFKDLYKLQKMVEKSLFSPTFWKSGSGYIGFSGIFGNPADDFLQLFFFFEFYKFCFLHNFRLKYFSLCIAYWQLFLRKSKLKILFIINTVRNFTPKITIF
jgi:hypothetical protein